MAGKEQFDISGNKRIRAEFDENIDSTRESDIQTLFQLLTLTHP